MTPDPTDSEDCVSTVIVTTAGETAVATACQSALSPPLVTGATVVAVVGVDDVWVMGVEVASRPDPTSA